MAARAPDPHSSEGNRFSRLERALVVLIALHSYAVGFCLLFLTRWGAAFGGFGEVSPLFFPRQAGIFHFVVATAYLVEYLRYRGVAILLAAKATAVVFLVTMTFVEPDAWSIPLSAVADALMGLVVTLVHARARQGS